MKQLHIAIVVSQFNTEVTALLLQGALAQLQQKAIAATQIKVIKVPGAVEIPLTAKALAQTKKYDAIICLGAVIRGDTDHYDYVCQQVSHGCQQVMLDYTLPVIFGILTTDNDQQALDRAGGAHGNKGAEAADVALEMIGIMQMIQADGGEMTEDRKRNIV